MYEKADSEGKLASEAREKRGSEVSKRGECEAYFAREVSLGARLTVSLP